ncbi:hypothetical protein ASG92_15665 [Arthrobacter sp. Soil736]|uniref:hypothetical protein n=1 Tax=Arthrobacter sp. Soil736 TaxID=1736395 RepID=UPI0006FEA574|nr:hypothetical protein [Arthrobacter sp. Soil736]KRE66745.1 hypothetical protein ASG92_15665 [Arthrobacter sp. Soil736]
MPSLSSETFAADLEAGLVDVGTVTVTENGIVSINSRPGYDDDESRSFIFLDSVDEIRASITIDDAAWQPMWPGWTLEKASIAMFSVHVQEAISTAPDSATTLKLVEGGVLAE